MGIESMYLNDQTFNITVQHILVTCGISICRVCSIRNYYLENTSSKLLVKTVLRLDGGDMVSSLSPWSEESSLLSSRSYGLNDALALVTLTVSELEQNYPVRERSMPRIFINVKRERSPYNHNGKVVYKSLAIKDSSSAVRSFILVNANYLIRHVNKRIKSIFPNIIFNIINFLVPGDIIFCLIFTFFLRLY